MSAGRLFAVIVILGGVSAAWVALGTAMWARTEMLDDELSDEMARLIGPEVVDQPAPYWSAKADAGRGVQDVAHPSSSRITADIVHDDRYKGLLWYSTFNVKFSGIYTLEADDSAADGFFIFELPRKITKYADLKVTVDDAETRSIDKTSRRLAIPVSRKMPHRIAVSFSTFGQKMWLYSPSGYGKTAGDGWSREYSEPAGEMTELKDLSLTIATNFKSIDYPSGSASPTTPASGQGAGMKAIWKYDSLVTNQAMGMVMPQRLNAGPIASRMSLFAPVSLLFFFAALFTVVVLRKIPLHPMHYLFISAGFFSFHILLAYLADQMSIHAAFWICAIVSVVLVVSYMRLVAGVKFAVTYVAFAQLVYLVGFSYAFFWEGKTGLTITIGAIATLFVLMMATGRVDWSAVFSRSAKVSLPSVPPTPPIPQSPRDSEE